MLHQGTSDLADRSSEHSSAIARARRHSGYQVCMPGQSCGDQPWRSRVSSGITQQGRAPLQHGTKTSTSCHPKPLRASAERAAWGLPHGRSRGWRRSHSTPSLGGRPLHCRQLQQSTSRRETVRTTVVTHSGHHTDPCRPQPSTKRLLTYTRWPCPRCTHCGGHNQTTATTTEPANAALAPAGTTANEPHIRPKHLRSAPMACQFRAFCLCATELADRNSGRPKPEGGSAAEEVAPSSEHWRRPVTREEAPPSSRRSWSRRSGSTS